MLSAGVNLVVCALAVCIPVMGTQLLAGRIRHNTSDTRAESVGAASRNEVHCAASYCLVSLCPLSPSQPLLPSQIVLWFGHCKTKLGCEAYSLLFCCSCSVLCVYCEATKKKSVMSWESSWRIHQLIFLSYQQSKPQIFNFQSSKNLGGTYWAWKVKQIDFSFLKKSLTRYYKILEAVML